MLCVTAGVGARHSLPRPCHRPLVSSVNLTAPFKRSMRFEHNCSVQNMSAAGVVGCHSLPFPCHGCGHVRDGCAWGGRPLAPPSRCLLALPARLPHAGGSAHAHLRDSAALDCEGNVLDTHDNYASTNCILLLHVLMLGVSDCSTLDLELNDRQPCVIEQKRKDCVCRRQVNENSNILGCSGAVCHTLMTDVQRCA